MGKNLILLILSITFLLLSCKNDDPISPNQTGSIAGFVHVLPYSHDESKENSGFTVTLVGTDFSTVTDSVGRWRIDNVPQGIYDISWEKEGYSPWLEQGFQFVGNGTAYVPKVSLAKLPTFPISRITAETDSSGVYITCNIPDSLSRETDFKYLRYFIGRSIDVEAKNSLYVFNGFVSIPQFKTSVIFRIDSDEFEWEEFESGEKVYVVVYPSNGGIPVFYFDYTLGVNVFVNLNYELSKKIEITVP